MWRSMRPHCPVPWRQQRRPHRRRRRGRSVWTKMVPIMCAKYANDCTCTRRVWCDTWKRTKVTIGRTNWHRTVDACQMWKSRVDWKWWSVPIVIVCSAIWNRCMSIGPNVTTTPIRSPIVSWPSCWRRCCNVNSVIFCTTTKWHCSNMSLATTLPLGSSAPGATSAVPRWWQFCSTVNPNVHRVCTNKRNESIWKHNSCATNASENSKRKRNCSSTGKSYRRMHVYRAIRNEPLLLSPQIHSKSFLGTV